MVELVTKILNLTFVILMVGSALDMGLKLKIAEASKAFRNGRFVALTLIWGFIVGPACAVLLTKVIPLAEPYALGLILLGLAPCAPYLPSLAEKAGGDLAYAATFMVLTAAGSIVLMPFVVPLLSSSLTADAWTIAKPLVFFIAIPMIIGVTVRRNAEPLAEKSQPVVKKVLSVNNILLLGLAIWLYRKDFLSTVGTYAIGTLFLYLAILAIVSYGLSFGLSHAQKSVLSLGVGTRNTGAALAPLLSVAGTDQRAITICVMSIFIALIVGTVAARVLANFAQTGATAAGKLERAS